MDTETLPPPTFGEWLDEQLKARKWSRPMLANATGYSQAAVQTWVRDVRTPEERACRLIADTFGISHDEVLRRAGRDVPPVTVPVAHDSPRDTQAHARRVDVSAAIVAEPIRYIPVVGHLAADAFRASWQTGDYYPVPERDLAGVNAPVLFIVSGDCMEPRAYSGDLVLIERDAQPQEGDVVAVQFNDELTLKEYWVESDEVVLRAIKPGYAPIRIKHSDEGAHLIGVAKRWMRIGRV